MDSGEDVEERIIGCRTLVNACGPWASRLALLAGVGDHTHPDPALHVPLPVEPRRRCVFVVKCPNGPKENVPLVIDPSGSFFKPEKGGHTYIIGGSPSKVGVNCQICRLNQPLCFTFNSNLNPIIT